MTISELIAELEEMKRIYGDVDVCRENDESPYDGPVRRVEIDYDRNDRVILEQGFPLMPSFCEYAIIRM